jgi:hypothetical protein
MTTQTVRTLALVGFILGIACSAGINAFGPIPGISIGAGGMTIVLIALAGFRRSKSLNAKP